MKDFLLLLRHATLLIRISGKTFLIDPMLSPTGVLDPVPNAGNNDRIPLLDLPFSTQELTGIINKVDAVVLTHLHRDHWDVTAQQLLPKDIPVICQPVDADQLSRQGFSKVLPVADQLNFNGVIINRTRGRHGTRETGRQMGEVSGFVLQARKKTIYIAGDTIWCPQVYNALTRFRPEVTVVNAGNARFTGGDPITMTAEDVFTVAEILSGTKVVAVHMDTINHCTLSRQTLRKAVNRRGLNDRILVPDNGAFF